MNNYRLRDFPPVDHNMQEEKASDTSSELEKSGRPALS